MCDEGPIGVLRVRRGEDRASLATLVDGFRICHPAGRTRVTPATRSMAAGGMRPAQNRPCDGPLAA